MFIQRCTYCNRTYLNYLCCDEHWHKSVLKMFTWILQIKYRLVNFYSTWKNTETGCTVSREDLYDFQLPKHWVIPRFVANTVFPNGVLNADVLSDGSLERLLFTVCASIWPTRQFCPLFCIPGVAVKFAFQPEKKSSILSRFAQQIWLPTFTSKDRPCSITHPLQKRLPGQLVARWATTGWKIFSLQVTKLLYRPR